ncbi:MAG: hypothetical protein OXG88_10680 [Gammaproteobacteria bacterium]|nr:hypothetical protein [Gammaproteobacteria bacterium]
MSNPISKLATGIGFLLLGIFALLYVGLLIFAVFLDLFGDWETIPIYFQLMMGAGLFGIGILFFTVLFTRIKEHKTDKYKNVEI